VITRPRRRLRLRGHSGEVVTVLLFAVLYALLAVLSPPATDLYAVNNLLILTVPLAAAALGTTVVLITGGFDLSVAGTIGLANVLAVTEMGHHPQHPWLIALAIIATGMAAGFVNGCMVTLLGLQSLGVTLATYIVLSGVCLIILPAPGSGVPAGFAGPLTDTVSGVPVAFFLLAALAGLWLLFVRTRTGITAFALGADAAATRMSGMPARGAEITCYTLAGGLYAVAGLYLAAGTTSGDPNAGQPFLLTAFSTMALALVSFRGGSGSGVAVIFAAAALTVIGKLLFVLGVAGFWTGAISAAIVLAALALPRIGASMTTAGLSRRLALPGPRVERAGDRSSA
jgi:ribose transport system permease protein